jgi:hypothetical protein
MFAAYVWFTGRNGEDAETAKEAVSFAHEHWKEFLPCAHKGLGRLMIRIAGSPKKVGRRRKKLLGTYAGLMQLSSRPSIAEDTLYLSRGD